MVYEEGGISNLKNCLFMADYLVVPSLNVVTKNNLGFIPFFIAT